MTPIFTSILERSIRSGIANSKVADAREWFRTEAAKTKTTASNVIKSAQYDNGSRTAVGKRGMMLLFSYDPKEKVNLPYYDRFPLIFPFNITNDGFYGINMHYLPHRFRAVLMDNLYALISDNNYDEKTKLKLSYDVLRSYARLRYFKPCVKRYLNSQIRSSIITIPSNEWDIALFLPLERFVGATKGVVHSESVKTIRGIS